MNNEQFALEVAEWLKIPKVLHRLQAKVDPESSAATSQGNLLGKDTSDPKAKGTEIYSDYKNLPTATASILNHVQNRANFHPASMTSEELVKYFKAYTIEIDKTPFFFLREDKEDRQKFYSKDYDKLIDQVVSLYDGVSEQDKNKLKESIANMAKTVFSESSSEQWKNLFSQSTIDMNAKEPTIMIYYTSLHMKHVKQKAEVNEQEYIVKRTTYTILFDKIKANAEQLAKLDKQDVDDWINGVSSPTKPNAKVCFTTQPYSHTK
jgi:glutamyl/glutaminyl-tRNA synthetase